MKKTSVIKKCETCNCDFKAYLCRIKIGKARFCSIACSKTDVTVKCAVCGVSYSAKKWELKKKKTCSATCGRELVKLNTKKNNTRTCKTCNISFIRKNGSAGSFCSRECCWNSKKRVNDYSCIDCGIRISPVKTIYRCRKCSAKRMSGVNSPKWIEDRTQLAKKQERGDSAYKEWRKQVWLRDNFKCKIANPDCVGRIEAHHILGWASHPELRYQVNNGITLCHAHHPRVRAEEKRLIPTFQELVAVSSDYFVQNV